MALMATYESALQEPTDQPTTHPLSQWIKIPIGLPLDRTESICEHSVTKSNGICIVVDHLQHLNSNTNLHWIKVKRVVVTYLQRDIVTLQLHCNITIGDSISRDNIECLPGYNFVELPWNGKVLLCVHCRTISRNPNFDQNIPSLMWLEWMTHLINSSIRALLIDRLPTHSMKWMWLSARIPSFWWFWPLLLPLINNIL